MFLCPSHKVHQILIFVSVGILALLYGCAVGWTSTGIENLRKPDSDIKLETSEEEFIAAFFELGRSTIAVPIGMIGDKIGRKPIIYLCGLQHLLVWSLVTLTKSKYILFFARFLSGIATGTGNAVLFIYAGEISPPKIRGTVLSFLYTCYYLGILIQYVIGAYLSYRQVGLITLSICTAFFCFIFCVKESPLFLLTKSRDECARNVYTWLNEGRPFDEVNKEFAALKEYTSNKCEKKQSLREAFSDPVNRKCVTLVFVINFLTQLTGLPVLIAFIHSLYTGSNTLSINSFSILFASLQYAACCCATFLSDKIGRRKMYFLACIACILCHAVTASLYFVQNQLSVSVPGMSWILLFVVSTYACIYAAGLGPLTVIVRGELLPQSVKGIGSGLAVVSAGIACFLLIFIFNFVLENIGIQYNFIFFAFTSFSLLLLTHYKLPETRHRTLAEIQQIFRDSIIEPPPFCEAIDEKSACKNFRLSH